MHLWRERRISRRRVFTDEVEVCGGVKEASEESSSAVRAGGGAAAAAALTSAASTCLHLTTPDTINQLQIKTV